MRICNFLKVTIVSFLAGCKRKTVFWRRRCPVGSSLYACDKRIKRLHMHVRIYTEYKHAHKKNQCFCCFTVCFYVHFYRKDCRFFDGKTRPGIKLPLTLSFDYPSVQVQSEQFVTLDLILTVVLFWNMEMYWRFLRCLVVRLW